MLDAPPTIVVVRLCEAGPSDAATLLEQHGFRVLVLTGAADALRVLETSVADSMVIEAGSDMGAPLTLLREALSAWPGLAVVLVTNQLSSEEIAEAVGSGASDLLVRPVAGEQLLFCVRKSLAVLRRSLAQPPPPRARARMVFGSSAAMRSARELLEQVAPTSSSVLIRGESGTGKELVARAVHGSSPRAGRPFIKIDCTSLPDNLIESELFGYEKGAFTGAGARKLGRVQLADGGTLFLDEVGELPSSLQAKLLRLLQDREFERLGGKETLRVDIRIVAATHRDLETMVERGEFRQDLFYRLNVVPLWLPPLRARRVDIPELVEKFCSEAAQESGRPKPAFEAGALERLSAQRWPGNVRQLQNFVERLVVLAKSTRISEADVNAELNRPVRFATETGPAGADAEHEAPNLLPLSAAVRRVEQQALRRALEQARGNRSAAARLLGLSRSALYKKLEEYELS